MRQLKTSEDIRRFIAWLCDQAEKGKMAISKADKLSLMATRCLKAVEVGANEEIRQIIEQLERGMNNETAIFKSTTEAKKDSGRC